ncbi:MAG TPA: hypothetical protein VFV95_05675 [Vicinamibacterales bacterium]|nr:hypothetical protein [Vicinamibacterales bacterium]
MAKYVIRLGASGADDPAPKYEVDAPSDLHAAALAVRHFVRLGWKPASQSATLDVEAENQGPQTLSVASVLRWLRREGEGATFAREEGLDFLMAEGSGQ